MCEGYITTQLAGSTPKRKNRPVAFFLSHKDSRTRNTVLVYTGRRGSHEIRHTVGHSSFRHPQTERGKIEVAVGAYREIGSAKDFGKATGTYFVSLHIPSVKPTVYLKLFNGMIPAQIQGQARAVSDQYSRGAVPLHQSSRMPPAANSLSVRSKRQPTQHPFPLSSCLKAHFCLPPKDSELTVHRVNECEEPCTFLKEKRPLFHLIRPLRA